MTLESEKFIAARRASGMTIEQAARAGEMSMTTYQLRESNPSKFRLEELKGIYDELNDIAKPIFKEAVCGIFLP